MSTQCPTCGSEISADAVDGLCLKCLGRLGFFSQPEGPGYGGLLRLGDYELLEEIARGGMGVVYRARQLSLHRIVALKVVLHGPFSSPEFVRRFRNEAEATATLRHPNIVSIYEVGEYNGHHFLSMEYVDGCNLADLVRDQPLAARRAAGYVKSIAEAVHHAHQRGVLHRDLKPSNVLLDAFDQPRVTDFGLAKILDRDAELTATGDVLGSPNHMPPEQAAGKFSQSTALSDVYSLGSILYQLIAGRPPFQGGSLPELLAQVQTAEPISPRQLNPGIPVDLQSICLKCLQKEPARRYVSAQELALDLGRFLEQKPVLARPVSAAEKAWRWCRRRPLLAALSIGLVTTVILGVVGITWEWRQAVFHAQGELEQRLIAEQDAAKMRLNLYAADVAVASQAVQNGNLGLARATLDALRPKPGETDLRGFEWRYLWNRCRGNQLATLTGHQGTVDCAAFSLDGKLLATGAQDNAIKIWDTGKGELIKSLNLNVHVVWSLAFTADGKYLMSGSDKGVIFLEVNSWRVWTNFAGELAALSRTGTFLATAFSSPFYFEQAEGVKLWNWRTGALLRSFDQPAHALTLSTDGSLLAVAGTNNVIKVWDAASGKSLHEYSSKYPVWSLNFSPDGHDLLSAGWSSEVSLWDLAHDSPPRIISGHQFHVWSAVFSADGETIATTSSDQTVRLWDAATLQLKSILLGHENEVWCAAFSPDGSRLVTGGKDQKVLLWATSTASPPDELAHDTDFSALVSPDGKRLITVDPTSKKFWLWDTTGAQLVGQAIAANEEIAGFSADGKYIAAFNSAHVSLRFRLPSEVIPAKEVSLAVTSPEEMQFNFTGMSPDQKLFFAIDKTGLIHVWNAESGSLLNTLKGPVPRIRNAVLSSRKTQIAVCVERENIVRLFDVATGLERQLVGHRDFVSGLAFSPDGAVLATGSMDGTIRLWNTADGVCIASLPGHIQETTDVAFSPDGRTLASLGRNESLKLWHMPTLRGLITESEPHAGNWLRFLPDGRKLVMEADTDKLRLLPAPSE